VGGRDVRYASTHLRYDTKFLKEDCESGKGRGEQGTKGDIWGGAEESPFIGREMKVTWSGQVRSEEKRDQIRTKLVRFFAKIRLSWLSVQFSLLVQLTKWQWRGALVCGRLSQFFNFLFCLPWID
jgi:hypothetical protein